MSDIDTTTCTCEWQYHTGHDASCALWSNPDYVAGRRVWFIDRLAPLEEFNLVDPSAADIDDLIDMRLAMDEEPECDCAEEPGVDGMVDHAMDCSLQSFQPFVDGECFWDHHSETLQWWDPIDEDPGPAVATIKAPLLNDTWSMGYGDYSSSWSSGVAHKSCDHASQPLVFADGTTVYPRALHAKTKPDSDPDFALYLDPGWRARSLAWFIPWQDHGLPTIAFPVAAGAIVECFAQAKAGWSVELGCIGAHGRTGTVLACMAILAGTPTGDAAQWVWDNYCDKAIESDDQEWFILWFGAWHHGTVAPPRPAPPPPVVYKAPLTGSLFGDEEGTPVPFDQDLHEGSACPTCRSPIEKIKGGLGCSKRGCQHYDGLLRCRACERHVDAHPRHGHMCWHTACANYMVKEPEKKK